MRQGNEHLIHFFLCVEYRAEVFTFSRENDGKEEVVPAGSVMRQLEQHKKKRLLSAGDFYFFGREEEEESGAGERARGGKENGPEPT